ncbi:MAG: pyruvate dehydrogenase (acetyl-transferring), homodimeric type [Spirochaetaceae bacterium]|nr:MAG: pyruvate dehydrogenase (acetyl-transferring), homodimeric type [Spirochaetaceae bacterium]
MCGCRSGCSHRVPKPYKEGFVSEQKREYQQENQEWIDSLQYVIDHEPPERVQQILSLLQVRAQRHGVTFYCPGNTPYINTMAADNEQPYPGSRELERRIKSVIRWNAMAMVVRANRGSSGIGGHISTFASAATLYEVGFNHFFKGPDHKDGQDIIYFQGHAAPGIYARSFVEGRLSVTDLENFRQELRPDGGLTSYPHPRSMPQYWQFPTVSMGLGPMQAIYQARFMRYLEDKGLRQPTSQRVWAFLGDGEFDEPESMGALTVAAREQLNNLVFVVNCNLQRLDGPVRGNGKVIQELEAAFKGAGWNVIKVIWGSDWDPLIARDKDGLLVKRMNELVDGQLQKYTVAGGAYIRKNFFGQDERLLKMVESYSDEQLEKLRRGGHDPLKVYNAYYQATRSEKVPTVILAQTIKGYGLGEAGEGRNVTHQQKKLNEEELRHFRSRFGIPISDEELKDAPFYAFPEQSEEARYLKARRDELGGYLPHRSVKGTALKEPAGKIFSDFYEGSKDREVATTMAIVQMLGGLLKDRNVGKQMVPIVPDESRTFGMESLFRQVGIYSHVGQVYEPVDRQSLLYYKEATDGAILEEGITEAGCMSSFIAAGTSHSTYGVTMVPFFIYYSMFGFQRVGDFIWAAADARARGFLVGGTAGRTSLPGEGLQHADGHSHILALPIPSLRAYDPAYAYEVAVIMREGFRRMYVEQEDLIYYITVMNDNYRQPPMPDGVEDGILKGLYRFQKGAKKAQAHLWGSGAILNETLKAATILREDFGVETDVWSAPGYKQLYQDAIETERWNRLNPDKQPRQAHVAECMHKERGVVIAATDYLKALPLSVASWVPLPMTVLGTDGFGRSDNRGALRDYFEVDARHIVLATLHALSREGQLDGTQLSDAMQKLKIDPQKPDPLAL